MGSDVRQALNDIDGGISRLVQGMDELEVLIDGINSKAKDAQATFSRLSEKIEAQKSRRSVSLGIDNALISKAAVASFVTAASVMMLGVFGYAFLGSPRDALEYASFAFGCCAAIMAGLTTYYERGKDILFFGSFFLLILSTATFLAFHSQSAIMGSASLGVADAFLVCILCALRFYRMKVLYVESGRRWNNRLSGFCLRSLALVAGLSFLIFYGWAFLVHNLPCVDERAPLSACAQVWRFW